MLRKLYEAAAPSVLPLLDAFSVSTPGWYQPRYDAAWYAGSTYLSNNWKIFRDGTVVRMCAAANVVYGYDADQDRVISIAAGSSGENLYHDPVSTKHDPSRPSTLTVNTLLAGHPNPFVWRGAYYTVSGTTITKRDLTTGAAITTYTLTGSITWSGSPRVDVGDDGIVVAYIPDNGTRGVVRFFELSTGENLYESSVTQSKFIFVDRAHRNIWSVRAADNILEIYSYDVQPAAFNPFTVGSNRSRYRQDAVTTTVVGDQGEPARFCPVGWTLDPPDSGHLEHDYTLTDEDGVARNTYCGPQDVALVGTDVEIAAWTVGV